ncbi:hypothetical protein FQA39_LY07480 [Lamprigera yunnana]|nr:hypothetical protein FQA39_LY07480 [Lamprigera yunnana]
MFSRKENIVKKTGPNGVGRFKFLSLLVQEFKRSNSLESNRQVLANLANFAYDPINYDFLRQLTVIDLFLQQLSANQEDLTHFSLAGLCNLSCDPENAQYIIKSNGVFIISQLLLHKNIEIALNALSTLIFLINSESQASITTPEIINKEIYFWKIIVQKSKFTMHAMKPIWKHLIFPYQLKRRICFNYKQLKLGDLVVVSKKISESDVINFSKISGDTNPIHSSLQGAAIVHGAYLNGLVSGIIGTQLPGPGTIVVSQNLNFPNKCFVNETVSITVTITELRKIIKVKFECKTEDNNKMVLFGDARLMLSNKNNL